MYLERHHQETLLSCVSRQLVSTLVLEYQAVCRERRPFRGPLSWQPPLEEEYEMDLPVFQMRACTEEPSLMAAVLVPERVRMLVPR